MSGSKKRLRDNAESKKTAERDGELWEEHEIAFLHEHWCSVEPEERDEAMVAELLGRTLIACQVKAHYALHGTVYAADGTRTTTRQSTYRGWMEGDGDE